MKPTLQEIKEKLPLFKTAKDLSISQNWSYRYILRQIIKHNLDTSHFEKNGSYKRIEYERIIKICPECNKEFVTKLGHKKEKTYCSHRCSALSRDIPSVTKYRLLNNLENKVSSSSHYRPKCFENFEEKCQICGFIDYVEVHHIDGNRNNDNSENLIPLCANHHTMIHTKKHNENLQSQVDKIMLNKFGEIYKNIVPQKIFRGSFSHNYNDSSTKIEQNKKAKIIKIQETRCPTKEELAKAVWELPSTKLCEKYKVSDSSIVKWCKKLGIQKPPRGYWQKKNAKYEKWVEKPNKLCPSCKNKMIYKESKTCRQCWIDG